MPGNDKSATRGRSYKAKTLRRLRTITVLLLGFSLFQYLSTGSVSWPGQVLRQATQALGEFATRPEAGWRRASDTLEELGASREAETAPAFDLTGRVVRVADGDTVSVLDEHNKQTKVRLYGIDSPERDQPYGNAAKRVLLDRVSQQQVGVVVVTRDSYGRTVGTLYHKGDNINLAMVASGYAWWYQHYAPYEHSLALAEQQAREQHLGLWQDPDPVPPWEWRHSKR
ncbi:MAG: thermonuclease family protein [Halioglobus sp.]